MAKQLNARIITKHDKAANWDKAATFIPKLGEIIVYEEDDLARVSMVPRIKVGNGLDNIKDLPFVTDPYVVKQDDMGLSQNNYTNEDAAIVKVIRELDYEPQYTDTKYTAGKDLGLVQIDNENYIYNKGISGITPGSENGTLKITVSTGPNNSDYNEAIVKIPGLQETAFTPISQLAPASVIDSVYEAVNSIESGDNQGTIKYHTNGGVVEEIAITGLGKLAFKDFVDAEVGGEQSVYTSFTQPTADYPIWVIPGTEGVSNLKVFNPVTKVYESISSSGVSKVEAGEAGYISVTTNGEVASVKSGDTISLATGSTNGAFEATINGSKQTIAIKGLGSNAYSSTSYLPLSGGTVTGTTTFSNTTDSSSINTGAVQIKGGLGVSKNIYASQVYGAVYNDYAEYRDQNETIEPGYITYCDDDGKLKITTQRLQKFEGVVSDTFGFAIGKTRKHKTPIAVSGRVLVYAEEGEHFHAGDCVCAGPGGRASYMTRSEIIEFPDRIVGVVSEVPTYKVWGEKRVPVNGRIWIKVK